MTTKDDETEKDDWSDVVVVEPVTDDATTDDNFDDVDELLPDLDVEGHAILSDNETDVVSHVILPSKNFSANVVLGPTATTPTTSIVEGNAKLPPASVPPRGSE